MDRARRAVLAALFIVSAVAVDWRRHRSPSPEVVPLAVGHLAGLQPRGGRGGDRRSLGVGRVRGAHNAGGRAVDLAGLEVVYVTSTGSTVTRKATWAVTRSWSRAGTC